MAKVTKAVFPVAGMGTRFLPATKASPKEMLPIVDKPLIQYAVEEAVEAGIEQIIFITGRSKRAIEDHFDKAYEIEAALEARGKTDLLETLRGSLPSAASYLYIRQPEALGLGHAVLCAEPVVWYEPFAVILADDLIDARPGVIKQMIEMYEQERSAILGVQNVAPDETDQYGIIQGEMISKGLHKVTSIVEKPKPAEAPSTLGVVGRYILTPRIFQMLHTIPKGAGGEIQLTDGIAQLLEYERVLAYEFKGTRYDCGGKMGYMKATVEYGLRHPELDGEFADYLRERVAQLPAKAQGGNVESIDSAKKTAIQTNKASI